MVVAGVVKNNWAFDVKHCWALCIIDINLNCFCTKTKTKQIPTMETRVVDKNWRFSISKVDSLKISRLAVLVEKETLSVRARYQSQNEDNSNTVECFFPVKMNFKSFLWAIGAGN